MRHEYGPEDYVTLWDYACGGRAFEVKPVWLEGQEPLYPKHVRHAPSEGDDIRCLSCGRPLGNADFGTSVTPRKPLPHGKLRGDDPIPLAAFGV